MTESHELNLKIVLLGIPLRVAEGLGQIVSEWGTLLYVPPTYPIARGLGLIREANADVVFVWTGGGAANSLLEALREAEPDLPTVAVNVHLKSREILDALDYGAVDYCTPPFDKYHLEGMLQTAFRPACC